MRVIAGSARGRKLLCPPGHKVRPTPDRVREALFSILGEAVPGARVADLFAGTGALGLEALSRGADSALFVEKDRRTAELLRKNIEGCGFGDRAQVMVADSVILLSRGIPGGADLVFLDPPYAGVEGAAALAALVTRRETMGGTLMVLEHSARLGPPPLPPGLAPTDERRYGDTALLFLRFQPPDQTGE